MRIRSLSIAIAVAGAVALGSTLTLAKPGGHGPGGNTCDPTAVAAAEAAITAACPCTGPAVGTPWKNHGQYVRCLAHATRDEARSATLKRRCLHTVVSCGARSTCGKSETMVACRGSSVGTCTNGACSNDPTRSCTVDADCTEATCAITTAARCTDTPGTGSCCDASPSGAFLN